MFESKKFLKQVVGELSDSSCTFMTHSYGAFSTPMVTAEQLEKDLAPYFGDNVWTRIKVQRDLSKSFENDIEVFRNQVAISEFNNFKKELKSKDLSFWNELAEKYGCMKGYSIPIFTDNFEYAFVYEYALAGPLSGVGSCRIYRQENKKWILIKTFNEWVS